MRLKEFALTISRGSESSFLLQNNSVLFGSVCAGLKGVKYGSWEEENMERALDALRNKDMGLNAFARTYSIPKAILKRRFDGKNCYAVGHKKSLVALEIFLKTLKTN
jgi:hypothetical protein